MATTQLCVHPQHAHSFKAMTFPSLGLGLLRTSSTKCAGCHQVLKLKPSVFTSSSSNTAGVADASIVKCVACGTLAHRSCALSSTMLWDDVCSVNGPSVQKAAMVVVTDDEADEDDDCLQHDSSNNFNDEYLGHHELSEELEEFELNLDEKIANGKQQQQQQQPRKNSFVSHASSEESLATQSLDGMELEEQDEGMNEHRPGDEDRLLGMGEVNLKDPNGDKYDEQQHGSTTPPQGKSPQIVARRTISKILALKNSRKENGDNNPYAGEEEERGQHDNVSESYHDAGSGQLPVEGKETMSPNTARKRTWFRGRTRNNTQPNDGNETDVMDSSENNNNGDGDAGSRARRGWFSNTNKQKRSSNEESESHHSDDIHSQGDLGVPISSTTTTTATMDIPQPPLVSATPRMPWLSTMNPNAVEEEYGEDAEVSNHSHSQAGEDEPTEHYNKGDDINDDSNAQTRRAWFQRRPKSNRDISTSDHHMDRDESFSESAHAASAEEQPPKRFSLFSSNKKRNQDHNDSNTQDNSNNNETAKSDGEITKEPSKKAQEDVHEAEFSEFLNVGDDENPTHNDENATKEIHAQQEQNKKEQKERPQMQEKGESKVAQEGEIAEQPTEENPEPSSEEKRARIGFGIFRRGTNEHGVEEEHEMSEEEVRFDHSDSTLDAEEKKAGRHLVTTLFSAVPDNNEDKGSDVVPAAAAAAASEGPLEMSTNESKNPLPESKSRFRLFSRKADDGTGEKPDPSEGEHINEEVMKVGAAEVSLNKRPSLMNSLWRHSPQQGSEEHIDGGNPVEGEHERDTDHLEDSEKADQETAAGMRTSILSRVFAPSKKLKNAGEDEKLGTEQALETENAVTSHDEPSTRRFLLFSKRGGESTDKVETQTATGANEAATPSEEQGNNDKTSARKFSLFGFGRAKGSTEADTEEKSALKAQSWAAEGPPSHWTTATTATTATFQKPPILRQGVDGNDGSEEDDMESEPLHYANHPFASVSRALQDNILAVLGCTDQVEDPEKRKVEDGQDKENSTRKPPSSVSLIVSPNSPASSEDGNIGPALGEIRPQPVQESTLTKVASGTYEAVKATALAQQKMGMASVAGGIAGGVAGLMFAGPAGALMGVRYGQTAGALGVVLEGSLTVGIIIGGVASGRFTAEKIQEQLEEQRILTIGETGVARKVMLVRPTIHIDPAWHDIWAEAQRTSPASSASSFSLFSSIDPIKQERYERTSDICDEEDIPTNEKVLLLVSRVLSDKDSFPGHVYRCLMQSFKDRCQQRRELRDELSKDKEDFPHLFEGASEDSVNMGDGLKLSLSPRARREDAHGVIKYITATLLEVRPGLASTPEITETTASVVEALVFGEVYDLVYEEIAIEATEQDKKLIEKIDDFEFARLERTGMPLCTEGIVSKAAIDALRRLPETHAAADKLRHCVVFLERISDHFASASSSSVMGADSLLKMVCQHILAAKMPYVNAEIAFLEEFARDEQLLRGKEGYALVTLQASLHFLNMSVDFERDIFGQENEEENVPILESSSEDGGGTAEKVDYEGKEITHQNGCTPPTNSGGEEMQSEISGEQHSERATADNSEKTTEEAEAREEKKEEPERVTEEDLL